MNAFTKRPARYTFGSVLHPRRTSTLLAIGALLAVLFVVVPAAHAQIIFGIQLSERGQEAITDPDRMDAKGLLGLLAEEGRFVYRGEKPVMAKQIVFIVGEHGERRKRIESKPFELEPGAHPVGKYVSGDEFFAPLEDALAPQEGVLVEWFRLPSDEASTLTSDAEKRFSDSVFGEMGLKDRQVGVVMALVPAEKEMLEQVQFQPVGFAFAPLECALAKAAC